MMSAIHFQQVTKRYGSRVALEGVDLAVERGSTLALLGPNGAGKSTLFGLLLGLVRPTEGHVLLDGRDVTPAARSRIGYMPERVALYSHSTVAENGRFFARLKSIPVAEVDRQLERVGLHGVSDRPARELSKGMLQRLGLAIALCGTPDILVLDEPFNGLDPALLETLQSILAEEQDRGATLLISTHTMSAVEPLATHAAVLLDGRLSAHATMARLQQDFGEGSLERAYHRIAMDRAGGVFPSTRAAASVEKGAPHCCNVQEAA